MGRYRSRYCSESEAHGVWDTVAGVWVEGLTDVNSEHVQGYADNLNDADAAFIMEVGR